jgi:hypothetical protein
VETAEAAATERASWSVAAAGTPAGRSNCGFGEILPEDAKKRLRRA